MPLQESEAMKNVLYFQLILILLCGGCTVAKQAKTVDVSGFLGKDVYAKLQKGKEDQALLFYRNETIDSKKYSKVLIDPVRIYTPKDASADQVADQNRLANNFYRYLHNELKQDTRIVTAPEPGTVRYQVAITSAEESNRFLETMSFLPPYGLGISVGKDFITGKPTGVGEITMEIKAVDAITGELLGAAVDRRVGGKEFAGMGDTWDDANKAMQYWAKRLRYVNCQHAGRAHCIQP